MSAPTRRHRRAQPRRRNLPALAAAALAVVAAAAWFAWRAEPGTAALDAELERAFELRELPPNRWVRWHEERPAGWSRQGHAGIAFDAKRGSLLVFGSDTHGGDWDNAVHEFHPLRKRWERHQAVAGPDTYRVDASGVPVAGGEAARPWAMHTYDAIEVDAARDALVVMSTTEHNPRSAAFPGATRQPTWVYDLATRRWRPVDAAGGPAPSFFGGSAAYDERRGVIVAFRHGLWEFDGATGAWHRVPSEMRIGMHHTMVYDRRRGRVVVFGDYRATDELRIYEPGATVGAAGRWTRVRPQGTGCPLLSASPAAYAGEADLFVVATDEPASGGSAATYLYDAATMTCTRLADAALPALGMNFMMTEDRNHAVVWLVTGDARGTVTVWALKPRR